MPKIQTNSLLPYYTGFVTLLLIVILFIVDKETPKAIFILLLIGYLGLLAFYWRQHSKQSQTTQIRDLNQYKSSIDKPATICNFEAQAQAILRQMSIQKNQSANQISYYSPFSQEMRYPSSLKELPTPSNDSLDEPNIFGTYNIQSWRQQFRLALQQFKENLESQIRNVDTYKAVVDKLDLKPNCLAEAQEIVMEVLRDRASHYCTYNVKIIDEVNKILARNFGLNLTKVQSTNPKQIGIDEFRRLLDFYRVKKTLPSAYKNMAAPTSLKMSSQIGMSIEKSSLNKLQSDLEQLIRYLPIFEPISYFPLERFNPCLLFYILRNQFPNEQIEVNSGGNQGIENVYRNSNYSYKSRLSGGKQKTVHNMFVQMDNSISLANFPEFRTKNCLKICVVLFLDLIRKGGSNGHPALRAIRRFMK